MTSTIENSKDIEIIKDAIRDVPDFPKPGILFKDITTLLSNTEAFTKVMDLFAKKCKELDIDYIVALESRGFIFGSALANHVRKPLTLVRKPGKLPAETIEVSYELEYGSDSIQIHKDAFDASSSKRVLIIDDLLATGGTAAAACELVTKVGGIVCACAFVIELDFLKGREKLDKNLEIYSLVHF